MFKARRLRWHAKGGEPLTLVAANDVGVVAIGRNEGERLIDCLTSVRAATANLVYVDSGSTDGSVVAAEKLGADVVNLELSRPFTAARARNEGFAMLNATKPDIQFVQFIDGDCILAQHWIEKALAFIENRPDVAIVCGRRRERYPTDSIYNRILDDEWNTPIGEANACGGDALVRVSAFESVDGFRTSLIAGEEPELCIRLRGKGWKIWRLDDDMTQHDAAMHTFGQWWLRSVRSGYAFAEVSRLHRKLKPVPWRRELGRAVCWAGILPLVTVVGGLIKPLILWLTLAYPLQVVRLGVRRGAASSESWWCAILSIPTKFAELEGILKYYWLSWRRKNSRLIEYK
jgi:GT2 family glycosyltransferase